MNTPKPRFLVKLQNGIIYIDNHVVQSEVDICCCIRRRYMLVKLLPGKGKASLKSTLLLTYKKLFQFLNGLFSRRSYYFMIHNSRFV